jgi:hypothetical protein
VYVFVWVCVPKVKTDFALYQVVCYVCFFG